MPEMKEWKNSFEKNTLERGKNAYLKNRVTDLKETENGYQAAVLGRERFEVSVKQKDGVLGRMSCRCPKARGGGNCEHMAAVLYAIEGSEKTAEKEKTEAMIMEQWRKLDEELRRQEKKKEIKEQQKRQEEAKAAKEKRQEEARAAEQKRQEEARAAEASRLLKEQQEARRLARKLRKEEQLRKEEEKKQKAAEQRRLESEKRQAEEERREAIRKQKAEEAKARAEKRKKEQEEARRMAEERKKEQEEARRIQEEQERQIMEEQQQHLMREKRKENYTLLGNPWEEDTEFTNGQNNTERIASLEKYNYFQAPKIINSIKISKKVRTEGEKLCREENIILDRMLSGYTESSRELFGEADATGTSGRESFPVRILFSRTEVEQLDCRCPKCRKSYYAWYSQESSCPYVAGVLYLIQEHLKNHNMGDATDESARWLLSLYQKKRANQIISDIAAKEGSLTLIPRLTRKNGKLSVAFKIGEKRLFIIKKLDVFCQNVKESATDIYGSNTKINHNQDNFTKKGKKWLGFISRIVSEEEEYLQRLEESRFYMSYHKGVGSELSLSGWRLDEFYRYLEDDTVEFEDKDGKKKKKEMLTASRGNPKVTMHIAPETLDMKNEFHGVYINGNLPNLYYGAQTAYFIGSGRLNQVESDFMEKIEPLANISSGDEFSFQVGRNHMSEFYYRILPELREIVEVTETEAEKIHSYLMPEARFTFYLDAAEDNATCGIYAGYGQTEVSVLDLNREEEGREIEAFRDKSREEEVLYQVRQLFPETDLLDDRLHCGNDENLVYRVMQEGAEILMGMGEVRCTKRFLRYNSVKQVKVSVGVSVSSGLLELDIGTEDISHEELLEILKSYRTKRKYYRLEDGSFVDLNDNTLEMLAELMDSAHIRPKEFVKGKMHLPMYRTLYLDKMLEEHENVSSRRDSHFREVVKGFKTIKDADFEEPESLSKIMRKYQKDGYKWLRTLETWQFGGILADDMGLGKTLQVIAVLLAARQEGREGTSLVVAPASLVFNWAEEFERFAPQLSVSVITGSQEERQKKIDAYEEPDVLVTSYDLLKRDIHLYEEKQFMYEVIDEAQYIKNHTTAAAKAVKVINSKIRYALTGTPIENRLSELWSIFDYLMPGFLYGYDVFKREIETPVVKNNDEGAMKRLQKMVGPFILRRLKEDVLRDLPEKLEECRYVRFESTQQQLYDGQVLHMRETLARQDDADFNKNKIQILAEITRLRQICCDPSLCFENYRGEAAKLEACLQLIQSAMDGGHRMLIFSQFKSMLEILQQKLDSAKIPYFTITGSTSKENRLQLVKQFNEGDTPVFLISLKAGGVGLNLTGADVVIHYDPWWNLAVQNQATDRAHRIGQTKKVTVYKLIVKNTIEEKIQKLQETKKNLAEQVIGGEMGQLGALSKEELLELLEV